MPSQRGERIDRRKELRFTFDGKEISAFEGDTYASALLASGQKVLSRSFKYHRPRGVLCCTGRCPNCLVEVDGWPGIRACTEPVRNGAEVRHLNAWPSLRFDAMRIVDRLSSRLTPPGFYYKTFIRPRRLWPLYRWALRNAAGLGRLEASANARQWDTEYRRRHADVLVIGGGIAGLTAARTASERGADVVLVDEGPELGGELLGHGKLMRARALAASVGKLSAEILSPAVALGYFDGLVPVWQDSTLHQIRAQQYIVASGTIEQPLVFPGNDLPGVMLSGAACRLASLYAVSPGQRALVATCNDSGVEAALMLRDLGVGVRAVAALPGYAPGEGAMADLKAAGIKFRANTTVVGASGRPAVRSVTVAQLNRSGVARSQQEIECDLLVVSGDRAPASGLVSQAGASVGWNGAGLELDQGSFENLIVAGSIAGHEHEEQARASGALAGIEAAKRLGLGADEPECERLRAQLASEPRPSSVHLADRPALGHGKAFVCFCEDVTAKDVRHCIAEGFDSSELLKRYSTLTMGPCQGRMCQAAAIRELARESGALTSRTAVTTARPPWSPVPMGALAGRPFEPAKRSPLHGRHKDLGGDVQWAGDWRRPYHYGDPDAEVLAVHRAAGLIDVSTLGKLLVSGPDAPAFLNRLYPNRFDNLAPGRVRYGVLTTDAARITDDGTVCRLNEESYYVTTTSSGAEAVEAWFSWWLHEWDLDVHLTDLSHGVSALNLAGPKSRQILSSLTDLDCGAEAFAYLDGKQAPVAGVPCLILRIGFVGELGYELHCASPAVGRLWDSLLEAGKEVDISPFGLEPQRVLRLEKQHILVGQDTDSESNPVEAGMPWIVKLDKDEPFIGRWAMEAVQNHGATKQLVGFVADEVPTEGAVVVNGGMPAGLVTSARHSPYLRRAIGLAWVPIALAEDGTRFVVSDQNRQLELRVHRDAFFDPEQERLRG